MKKLKAFLISLAIAVFGTSCGYSPPYVYTRQPIPDTPALTIDVKVDKEFSDGDKQEIDNALLQWNYVLNGHYKLQVINWDYDASKLHTGEVSYDDHDYKDAFYFVKLTAEESKKFSIRDNSPDCNCVLGFAPIGGTLLFVVRDRMVIGDVYYTMMHEIAHMLGADHTGSKLMNPSFSHRDFRCVDEKTALQVANFLGLKLSDLNWCYYDTD